jgi:GTP pyrophosphokinase
VRGELLADLFAVVEEFDSPVGENGDSGNGVAPDGPSAGDTAVALSTVDRTALEHAFEFACDRHADQLRYSGDEFITHPVGVAQICAGMRLDTETLCAALLHDTVEDTSASLDEIREEFGDEVAQLVDGVTKLTGITFESRDERQAENYRKMMVAMATDVRVILIKLADRLHNMRTLGALPKQKQVTKSRETLEIYAPLAHRLGIHAIKWELEDLAFATLHPRKYKEIKQLVAQQRDEREVYVNEAGEFLSSELQQLGIEAEISGRAKHFYSIYTKMTKKGREFNEIFDLTAMRVIVGSVKDCYGTIGVIHSIWKPLPGRFKDFVAMPKANMYQALHTTVIGPEGKPLEIQIRTDEMHKLAEYGIAAHVAYKEGSGADPNREKMTWLRQLVEAEGDQDPAEFLESLKVDLFEDEVFVFTPKGEVKSLSGGSTPLDFAYAVHTDVGHRCVGAKVNGNIVPLHYQLRSGDIVEVLTAKQKRGPSRDWLKLVRTSRARNKIRAFFKEERREDAERSGREKLEEALRTRGLPMQKVAGSALLADVIREMGYQKATEFYIGLGQGKVSTKTVANKLMQRLKAGEAVEEHEPLGRERGEDRARQTKDASTYGISVKGAHNVAVRLAKCCRPVPGDQIAGYVSLGRGITIHRTDCKNVRALMKDPERFVDVSWDGENESSYRVEIQIDAYDRTRLLEELSRTFSEAGINIIGASCLTNHPMVKNKFVVEVGDTEQLKNCISRLRNVESVFDVYRITPAA